MSGGSTEIENKDLPYCVGLLFGTLGLIFPIWSAIREQFPAFTAAGAQAYFNIGSTAADWLFFGMLMGLGMALLYLVVLPVSEAVGPARFTRLVSNALGLTISAWAIYTIWHARPHYDQNDLIAVFGGIGISTVGLSSHEAERRFVGLACLAGTVAALGLFLGGHQTPALVAAGIALLCGLSWLLPPVSFPALLALVGRQVAAQWDVVRGGFITYVLMIAASFVLIEGSAVYGKAHPGQIPGWVELLIFILSVWLFLRGSWKLLGVAWAMLKSLIPFGRSGFDMVAGQKVHGDAGYAQAGRVDAALRDQDQGGAPPRFRD